MTPLRRLALTSLICLLAGCSQPTSAAPTSGLGPAINGAPSLGAESGAEPLPSEPGSLGVGLPSGAGGVPGQAGAALGRLRSYRFVVSLATTVGSSSLVPAGGVTMHGTIIQQPSPATELDYVPAASPARPIHVVTVGDAVYLAQPDGHFAPQTGEDGPAGIAQGFAPEALYKTSFAPYAADLALVGTETRQGQSVDHYAAPPASLAQLSASYGLAGPWSLDVLVAHDDGHLVAAAIQGHDWAGGSFALTIDIDRVNAPGNTVSAPN